MISSWWLVTFDGGLPFHFSICRLLLYACVFRRAYFGECMLMMSKHIQLIVNNAIVPKKCLFSVGKYTNIMLMTFYRLFTARFYRYFSHASEVCMTIVRIYRKELNWEYQELRISSLYLILTNITEYSNNSRRQNIFDESKMCSCMTSRQMEIGSL